MMELISKRQRIKIEANRISEIMAFAVSDIHQRGGDPRSFSICLLRAAFEMAVETFPATDIQLLVSQWAAQECAASSAKVQPHA